MIKEKKIAVSVKDIHKEFILPQSKNTSFKQVAVNIVKKNNVVTQKVLDGVSFEVYKGDFFGVVGRNGGGKSTLLKLMAGVYTPTSGTIDVNGGLTPFIELGVGFNPELSGRDNVYLNGALLGYNRRQMDLMYDDIVNFAELGSFMDQKLKNYSSGMQVRLAFSIAIKAKNEILIFDEVLAVGDEAFQRKCIEVFEKYKAQGQTVILVTHDMETVKRFCNRAVLIDHGKIVEIGNPRNIANKYSDLNQKETDNQTKLDNQNNANNSLVVDISDTQGNSVQSFEVNDTMTVSVTWKDQGSLESIGINLFKESGEHVTGHNSRFSDIKNINEKRNLIIDYDLDITPGKYFIVVEAFRSEGKVIASVLDGPKFNVRSRSKLKWSGLLNLPHKWRD